MTFYEIHISEYTLILLKKKKIIFSEMLYFVKCCVALCTDGTENVTAFFFLAQQQG